MAASLKVGTVPVRHDTTHGLRTVTCHEVAFCASMHWQLHGDGSTLGAHVGARLAPWLLMTCHSPCLLDVAGH